MADITEIIKSSRYGNATNWVERLTFGRAMGHSLNLGAEIGAGHSRHPCDPEQELILPHVTDQSIIKFDNDTELLIQSIPDDGVFKFTVWYPDLKYIYFSKTVSDLRAEVEKFKEKIEPPRDRFDRLVKNAAEWPDHKVFEWFITASENIEHVKELNIKPEDYGHRSIQEEKDLTTLLNFDASIAVINQRAERIIHSCERFSEKALRQLLCSIMDAQDPPSYQCSLAKLINIKMRDAYYMHWAPIEKVSFEFQRWFVDYSHVERAHLIIQLNDLR